VGITITPDYSVKVMPLPDFEGFMDNVKRLDDNDPQERLAKILYTSFADEVELDKQNRIKVSPLLMEECKIGRNVVVIGCQDHIQIFDEDVWREYRKLAMQNLGAATMRLTEIEKARQAQAAAAPAAGSPAL
jgi:division/cell wall cluster transcriptional repressor MraZ